jgi:hypothetical protein
MQILIFLFFSIFLFLNKTRVVSPLTDPKKNVERLENWPGYKKICHLA